MSEDPRTRTTTHQQPETPAPKSAKLDLSVSKVLGGALAAMTAAGLGSRLSVAGTVVGAALASIIAAVAGAIYTASLHRTQEKVRTAWTGKAGSAVPAAGDVSGPAQTAPGWAVTEPARTGTGWAGTQPTAVQPAPGWSSPVQPASPAARRLNWKGIIVGAFSIFAIAAVALTGFELISGHALSGGTGTTFTQVSEAKEPTKKPTSTSTSTASPTPSDTPSATPSETSEPTSTASSTPEPSKAPATPSTAPTPTASPTASATPSAATPVPSGSATE